MSENIQLEDVAAPMVHLNGTGDKALLREVDEALDALITAKEKLERMTVHSRDYYVMEDANNVFQKAWTQAAERHQKVSDVISELTIYRWRIRKQVKK